MVDRRDLRYGRGHNKGTNLARSLLGFTENVIDKRPHPGSAYYNKMANMS